MDKKLVVSSSPHILIKESTPKIMYTVTASLIPAGIGAVYFFGIRALWIMLIGIVSAVITEFVIAKMLKKPVTVTDGSAVLTGLLLSYNVSVQVPLWMPAVGAFFGIAVGKMVFGGLGYNPMNPALLGRAFLLASWPAKMTVFDKAVPQGGTVSGIDMMTSATPLNVYKSSHEILANSSQYSIEKVQQANEALGKLYDSIEGLFWGKIGGCIGETSAALLLLGAAFLMYKRYIGWKIPFFYIGTVAVLSWIFGAPDSYFGGNVLFALFSGGLILGAFYMATDMVTSPVTFRGRIYFGIGCGVITFIIRRYGGYPEGVSYSILLMNLVAPLLDRYTQPKIFGGRKKK
ncbi:MAG: RnfABCDGE type electron transport complex subunit D [candidate division KSB1 bacterium]|nr:RnfABCDGE type electron transport complex subunit D [candidate division KSB1 bacterium]